MKEKTFRKGEYTLVHSRYVDHMGFERDSFYIAWHDKSGLIYNLPFLGDIKVHTHKRNEPINTISYIYTKKDYEKMLDEQVKRLTEKKDKN